MSRNASLVEPQIWSSVIRSLRIPLIEHDLEMDDLLEKSGISPEHIRQTDGRVPLRSYLRFMEIAAREAGNPILGVHLARSAGPETLGAIGFLFLSSKTIVRAFRNLCHYMNLLQGITQAHVTSDEHETAFVYQILHAQDQDCRQDVEFSLSLTRRMINMYGEGGIKVQAINFRHSPLVDRRVYERTLRAPVFFNQENNSVVIPTSHSQTPSKVFDPALSPILKAYLDRELEVVNRLRTLSDQVDHVLYGNEIDAPLTARKVAHHLGMSEATLYRRLRDEGQSFSVLLDSRNYELARDYLRTTRLTITQIAYLVGFTDSASFNRAFRRWSGGITPSAFRKDALVLS